MMELPPEIVEKIKNLEANEGRVNPEQLQEILKEAAQLQGNKPISDQELQTELKLSDEQVQQMQQMMESGVFKEMLQNFQNSQGAILPGQLKENPELTKMAESVMKEMSKNNPFSQFTAEQIKDMLRSQYSGSPIGKFFQDYPKFENFVAHWFVDKEALPKAMSIGLKKKRLRNYGIFAFMFLIFGFYFSAKIVRDDVSIIKKFVKKLGVRLVVMVFTFGLFYSAFFRELSPTIRIAKQYLF
ncbi:MAG: hypothetical protein H6621_08820 [Halobacteriovoraceae bacterium]|nr:hypothetical protein [Halobacteriovoraceae bacterium]